MRGQKMNWLFLFVLILNSEALSVYQTIDNMNHVKRISDNTQQFNSNRKQNYSDLFGKFSSFIQKMNQLGEKHADKIHNLKSSIQSQKLENLPEEDHHIVAGLKKIFNTVDQFQSFLQLMDPKQVESVTQVKTADGRVLSTTRVRTEEGDDGVSVTTIIHQDENSAPVTTKYTHNQTLEHHATHSLEDASKNKGIVNVILGDDITITQEVVSGTPTSSPSSTPTPTVSPSPTPTISITPSVSPSTSELPLPSLSPLYVSKPEDELIQHVIKNAGFAEKSLNYVNAIWFWLFIGLLLCFITAFPVLEGASKSGTFGWVYWTSASTFLIFLMYICWEMIGLHILGKSGITRIANFLIDDIKLSSNQAVTFSKSFGPNPCADAWISSPTARLTSNQQLYYTSSGSMETWSPIARWNSKRDATQKKIPNPSDCSIAPGTNTTDPEKCPGKILFQRGGEDYCHCQEAMSDFGFDPDFELIAACSFSRFVMAQYMFNTGSSTASKFAHRNSTSSKCVGVSDAQMAIPSQDSVSIVSYGNSGFSDANAFLDGYAILLNQYDGLIWNLNNCPSTNMTIEVRYSSAESIPVEVRVHNKITKFSDNTTIALATTGKDVNFMTKNFVIGPVPSNNVKRLQISRTNSGNIPLYIHRINICTDGTSEGCPESSSSQVYCYELEQGFELQDTLFDTKGTIFTSRPLALRACTARMDCVGVVNKLGSAKVYQLMGGNTVASPNAQVYRRKVGLKDGDSMCLTS
eukprot:c30419_g1_i1.p1 GENE.c30419_g1_i1~~c30419_g1_i1.p1  ORF type:complete len:759 (+),score=257.92 c30419_g1_i1:36-2279(+)